MAKRPDLHKQVIAEHLDRLERLAEHRGVARLRRVYDQSQAEVVSKIAQLTRARRGSTFDAHHKRMILAQLTHGQAYVMRSMGEDLGAAAKDAQRDVLRALSRDVHRLEKNYRGHAPIIPIEDAARFQGVIDGRRDSLLRRHDSSLTEYGKSNVRKVENELSKSLLQGESQSEAIDRVASTLHEERWKGERIVRTELSWAANATQADGIRESVEAVPKLMMQWRELVTDEGEPLDERVGVDSLAMHLQVVRPGDLFVCPPRAPDGEEVSESLQYDEVAHPPNRPNDRATIAPWSPEWETPAWRWSGTRRVPMR